MTFTADWQRQLESSYAEFAPLALTAPDIDLHHGLLATAILWPIRPAVQDYDGDAIDALRDLTGAAAKLILKAVQDWLDDRLAAARQMAGLTAEKEEVHGFGPFKRAF